MRGRETPLLSFWMLCVELCMVFEMTIGISFPSEVAMSYKVSYVVDSGDWGVVYLRHVITSTSDARQELGLG
jgi:hypothetical protein